MTLFNQILFYSTVIAILYCNVLKLYYATFNKHKVKIRKNCIFFGGASVSADVEKCVYAAGINFY